jgi:hypothetical protein
MKIIWGYSINIAIVITNNATQGVCIIVGGTPKITVAANVTVCSIFFAVTAWQT